MSKFKKLVLSLILALALAVPTMGLVGCDVSLGGGSGQTTSQTDANNNQNNNNNNNNGNQNQAVLTYEKINADVIAAYNEAQKTVVDIFNNSVLGLKELDENAPNEPVDPEAPTQEEQQAWDEYNAALDLLETKKNVAGELIGSQCLLNMVQHYSTSINPAKMQSGEVYSVTDSGTTYLFKYTATADDATLVSYNNTRGSEEFGVYRVYNYHYNNGKLSKVNYCEYRLNQYNTEDKSEVINITVQTFDVTNLAFYEIQGNYNGALNGAETPILTASEEENEGPINYLNVMINAYKTGNITNELFDAILNDGNTQFNFAAYSFKTLELDYAVVEHNDLVLPNDDQTNIEQPTALSYQINFPSVEENETSLAEMLINLFRADFYFDIETITYNILSLHVVDNSNSIWFTSEEMEEIDTANYYLMDWYDFVGYDDNGYQYDLLMEKKEVLNEEILENIISGLIEWLSDDDNEGYYGSNYVSKEDFIAGLEDALINLANEEVFSGTINFTTENEENFVFNFQYLNVNGSEYEYSFRYSVWYLGLTLDNGSVVEVSIGVD